MIHDPDAALSHAPEHSWAAARPLVFPLLRPVATNGRFLAEVTSPTAAAGETRPLLDRGPIDLRVAFVLRADRYAVLVNGDHLAAWGISGAELRSTAMTNLRAWSAMAPWTEEHEGTQVLLTSVTGDGWDATRLLLPEVLRHLEERLGGEGIRVVVAVPTTDLLLATGLGQEDPAFAVPFSRFVEAYVAGTDDPIDSRIFEIARGDLIPFEP
jgi:uncharacterized protein YtpQ (UPF0354 family)